MKVKVVRIYLVESSPLVNILFQKLLEDGMKGATLIRGIKGFGPHKVIREAHLLDAHVPLPVMLEFYDEPVRVDLFLSQIQDKLEPASLIFWMADCQ